MPWASYQPGPFRGLIPDSIGQVVDVPRQLRCADQYFIRVRPHVGMKATRPARDKNQADAVMPAIVNRAVQRLRQERRTTEAVGFVDANSESRQQRLFRRAENRQLHQRQLIGCIERPQRQPATRAGALLLKICGRGFVVVSDRARKLPHRIKRDSMAAARKQLFCTRRFSTALAADYKDDGVLTMRHLVQRHQTARKPGNARSRRRSVRVPPFSVRNSARIFATLSNGARGPCGELTPPVSTPSFHGTRRAVAHAENPQAGPGTHPTYLGAVVRQNVMQGGRQLLSVTRARRCGAGCVANPPKDAAGKHSQLLRARRLLERIGRRRGRRRGRPWLTAIFARPATRVAGCPTLASSRRPDRLYFAFPHGFGRDSERVDYWRADVIGTHRRRHLPHRGHNATPGEPADNGT